MKTLSLVVPMYNEEANVDDFFAAVLPVLEHIGVKHHLAWEIVTVDDGSTDGTERRLRALAAVETRIRVLSFSRNFGKEAALTAGLEQASGDAVVPIDADLQHPPHLVEEMVRRWLDGAEVVAGLRESREEDTALKRWTSRLFYNTFNKLCKPGIPPNVGDFRLMDRMVVDALLRLPERNRFMKGLFSWVGFRVEYIPLACEKRRHGETKWNYWKLAQFALDGITSFSTAPLRICFWAGLLISCLAFFYGIWVVVETMFFGEPVQGFPTLMVTILFLGGVQMLGIGILGEYLGRLYQECKRRPLYILRDRKKIDGRPEKDPRAKKGGLSCDI